MEDFLLQLTGQLDQSSSKEQIDKDLITIAKAIEKLKLQAEIDPNSVKNIAKQLAGIINQKVVVNNIQIDNQQISKTGEQTGQKFGTSFNKSLQSSLNNVKQNIQNVISEFSNQKLNSYDLSKAFNLNRSGIDASVTQNIRSITTELNSLAKEVLKTGSDSSWEGIITKMNELYRVLNQFGTVRDLTGYEESLKVLDYFQNKKIFVGDKSEVLSNTGMSIKELNNQFRNLGVTFTSVAENSVKLDTVWDELFNISPSLQKFENFGDQINAIVDHFKIAKEALYGDSNLQPLSGGEINDFVGEWLTGLENASKKLEVLRSEQSELEQNIAQSSTSTANTVIQNEHKKQQAIQETANAYKALSENESIVKSGVGVITFEGTNNAAKEAQQYFRELLKDEQAVIATTEQFGSNNNLTSFAVNIKRASGEVETLRYTLDALEDDEGNITDTFYRLSGSSIGDSGAIKQIQQIENAFADFTQKLAQFKSTNSEILSGLTTPLSDFESKLAGLKNGTTTINEVTNAYKSLNTEASNITANFSRQLSPIDSAIRNLAKGEETISGLRAEFKGLNNAPKEINSELNKCVSLLANVKKIESEQGRTSDWSKAYKEWANSVDTLKAKLTTLRKEQTNVASTQIFNISDLKNNDIAYMSKVYNTIEKQMSEINKMANAKNWNIVDISGVEQADGKIKQLTLTVRDAEGALKKLTMQREKLQGNGKAQYGLMQIGDVKVLETASQAQEKLAQNTEKANAKLAEQANKIQLSLDTGDFETKILGYKTSLEKLGLSSEEIAAKMKGVTTAFSELKTSASGENIIPDNVIAKAEILDNEMSKLANTVKQIKLNESLIADDLKIEQTIIRLNNQLQANSRYSKDAKAKIKEWIAELNKGNVAEARLKQINVEVKQLHSEMAAANKVGLSFFDQLGSKLGSLSAYISASTLLFRTFSAAKNGISSVTALDTALVDLRKTANMTAKELEDFYYASNDVAKQMGVTTEEIITQAAAWSRLGFSTADQATQMAKLSSQFALISPGMDVDTATTGLVSIMKAYDVQVSDVLDGIESKINIIGNNLALSNANIVSMLQDSVSAMAEGRNTLEQTIALESAAYEIVQNDNVGNGFKTVALRLRGLNEETQELDDSLKTIKGDLYNLTGVSIMEDANTYKSTYQILKEISEVWDSLTDTTRAETLELMFGKLRSNIGAAVIKNFSSAEKAMDLMANSAGSATAELEIAMDSVSFKANQLKETTTGIAQNLFQREDMKNVLDVLNSFMNLLDKATEKLGLFGTAAAGLGMFAGVKNIGKTYKCTVSNHLLIVLNVPSMPKNIIQG